MVINYKWFNELTVFDGYFLPNEEVLINKTLSKKWSSKFDCKSGFYQIKLKDSAKPLMPSVPLKDSIFGMSCQWD